jgi:hypothetical protein
MTDTRETLFVGGFETGYFGTVGSFYMSVIWLWGGCKWCDGMKREHEHVS